MFETSDHEVIAQRNGYRARVALDYYPHAPENDGGCPILRIDPSGYGSGSVDHTGYGAYYDPGFDAEGALQRFVSEYGIREGVEVFARYLHIFHEGNIETLNLGHYRDYQYVTFVTRGLAQAWGLPDSEPVPTAELTEWTAYIEGDCYGVVIEEQTRTSTVERDREGHVIRTDEDDTWSEVDSCWGFYGFEHAKQSAIENLSYYADKEATA